MASTPGVKVEMLPDPPNQSTAKTSSAASTAGESVMSAPSTTPDVTTLLKSIWTSNPKVRTVSIRSMGAAGEDHELLGLLDGGATHPLRQGLASELQGARPVCRRRSWFHSALAGPYHRYFVDAGLCGAHHPLERDCGHGF